jgi:hypothetical protein
MQVLVIVLFTIIALLIICNVLIKRTNWYKNLFLENIYTDKDWYSSHDKRNYDLVVLGSSAAKWAFDFSDCNIKAMNWAQQPQTLVEDYNLLRNFHSILRKNGTVIITIMPFTSLNKKTNVYDALKYLQVHSHEPIEPYLVDQARAIKNLPIRLGKPAIKAALKYLLFQDVARRNFDYAMVDSNPMSSASLDKNAASFVTGWKHQFGISDFDAPLTEENKIGREFRINLMRTIIDFCIEREYNPVLVIPPVTTHLNKYYTKTFEETYIYSFLREVDCNVTVLDYSKNKELMKDDLYFNSFFMNKRGRKLFTKQVLSDIRF